MKAHTYSILFLHRGIWKTINDENNKRIEFQSVEDAKHHIDSLRKDKTHPINLVKYAVIYKFDKGMMTGAGIRY